VTDELHDAIAEQLARKQAEHESAAAASAADRFVPDDNWEAMYRQPDPHQAAQEVGVGLQFALYDASRQAAIDAGRFTPEEAPR
jgi:hypothetical protein